MKHADPAAQHRARFAWVSRGAILVSFSHMAGTMALYSAGALWDRLVAGAMTLIVDLALWSLAEYLLFCRQQGRRPVWIVPAMFGLAVVISIALNAAYLWANRPPPESVPEWLSVLIAGAFSVLVSGFIVAAAVVEGELLGEGQARAALVLDAEHSRTEAEQARMDAERWRLEAEQQGHAAEHWRTLAEQRRLEAEQRKLLPAPDPNTIVVDIGGRAYTLRQVAEAFGTAPSTASTKLLAVRTKGETR